MKVPGALRLGRAGALTLAGATAVFVLAIALYTRFGIAGRLSRDESIYAYGGQQLAHGLAPYASIFDAKSPGATLVAAIGALIARVTGSYDLYWIRAVFFLCACLAAAGCYLLAARLWRSAVAGVVAGVVFVSFNGFAVDALSGPDAKTPGILAVVLCLLLVTYRRWFWAAAFGSMAFLVWQPLLIYPVAVLVAALLGAAAGERRRAAVAAVAGGVAPVAVTVVYFAAAGALGKFVESAFVFPLTGVQRGKETVGHRISHIAEVIRSSYGVSGLLLAIGMAAVVLLALRRVVAGRRELRAAVADPLVCVVVLTMLFEVAYATTDFQGAPDVYPFLPYGAIGIGGIAAALVTALPAAAPARRAATALALAAAVALSALSWSWFTDEAAKDTGLRAQRANACAVQRMLGPTGRLYALGDPTPLVLTHRRNPDRFIYLTSGVDKWKVAHTRGGFTAWTAQIEAAHPTVVEVGGWHSALRTRMGHWLVRAGFLPRFVGKWAVYLAPDAVARAQAASVRLANEPESYATSTSGKELPARGCR